MSEKYSNVALKLGDDFKLRAVSAFRTKAMVVVAETKDAEGVMPVDVMPELTEKVEETEPGIMPTMSESHFDTHAISGTMFSFSSKDAFVYYTTKDDCIVARLRIPAGFSIVVTTKILSGRKDVNPYKLKHYSESADDRTLVRFVHEAPRDINMGPTSESWLKFATDTVEEIFN